MMKYINPGSTASLYDAVAPSCSNSITFCLVAWNWYVYVSSKFSSKQPGPSVISEISFKVGPGKYWFGSNNNNNNNNDNNSKFYSTTNTRVPHLQEFGIWLKKHKKQCIIIFSVIKISYIPDLVMTHGVQRCFEKKIKVTFCRKFTHTHTLGAFWCSVAEGCGKFGKRGTKSWTKQKNNFCFADLSTKLHRILLSHNNWQV